MKKISIALLFIAVIFFFSCSSKSKKQDQNNQVSKITFIDDVSHKKIDVIIDNKLFTSYQWPDDIYKPFLYPIMTASGTEITRGYPINPKPFERPDHPHQVGLWFAFGDVNGVDFWGNSFAIKPEDKYKYGSIKFKEIVELNSHKGILVVQSDWIDNSNKTLIREMTTFIFGENNGVRTIERITELTAVPRILFTEYKEGLFGLRAAREFEEPAKNPGRFLDANGNVSKTPILYNEGVDGIYRNAEGLTGGDVWGKRSPWVALRGEKEGEVITIAILDHPNNINYPAWSHARGYGLFATNNLAGRDADENTSPVEVVLNPGEKIVFKHKVVIGGDLTDNQIDEFAKNFK